ENGPLVSLFTSLSEQVSNLLHACVWRVIGRTETANAATAHRIELHVAPELEALGRALAHGDQVLCLAHLLETYIGNIWVGEWNPVERVLQFGFAVAVQAELSGIRTNGVKLPGVIFGHQPLAAIAPEISFRYRPVLVVML